MRKLRFELLSHPPYYLDLARSDYSLFTDFKKMLQGKRFGSNAEVIHAKKPILRAFTQKFITQEPIVRLVSNFDIYPLKDATI